MGHRIRSGGYTLPELVLGMSLTVMVAGAIGAFALALSQSWAHGATDHPTIESEEGRPARTSLAATINQFQGMLRISAVVRDAKLIGHVDAGTNPPEGETPAAVMLWLADQSPIVANVPTVDHQIQLSEIGLLQYDAGTDTVWLYRCDNPAVDHTWSYEISLGAPTAPADFRLLADRQVALARRVTGARFGARGLDGTRSLPALDFTLTFAHDGMDMTQCGTATLRSPDFAPLDD
jgi:hypothetical protein